MELLEEHNRKIRAKKAAKGLGVQYVPMKHSMKHVKAWEAYAGKKWYKLKPHEREAANVEIGEFIKRRHSANAKPAPPGKNPRARGNAVGCPSKTVDDRRAKKTNVNSKHAQKKKLNHPSSKERPHPTSKGSARAFGKRRRDSSPLKTKPFLRRKSNGKEVLVTIPKEEKDLLAAHNKKIRRQSGKRATYEPLKHRMADVRSWERQSGRRYYDLKPAEREEANRKISEMLRRKKQEKETEVGAKKEDLATVVASKHSGEGKGKARRRRRSSLLDVSNRNIDPTLFDFNTPASCYTDIGKLLSDGPTTQQSNANDEWFCTSHIELLVPDNMALE
jgi:hypothetical protein|eukprot:g3502.t1